MYKLITIDMDGTLLNRDKKITEYTKEMIKKAKSLGVYVVLASGRPLKGLLPYLKELDLTGQDDYVIGFNGAIVQKVDTGEILHKAFITGKDMKELYDMSKELGVNYHAFTDTIFIAEKNSKYTQVECDLNSIELELVDMHSRDDNEGIIKTMCIDEPEILDEAIKKIPAEVYEKYSVVKSAPFFLEFLNKKATKGLAVKFLAEHLGIKQEEVISFGDEENDFSMIEYAGLGVAMGNAISEVKEISNFITKTNEENGVAYAIEKFVINGEKIDV